MALIAGRWKEVMPRHFQLNTKPSNRRHATVRFQVHGREYGSCIMNRTVDLRLGMQRPKHRSSRTGVLRQRGPARRRTPKSQEKKPAAKSYDSPTMPHLREHHTPSGRYREPTTGLPVSKTTSRSPPASAKFIDPSNTTRMTIHHKVASTESDSGG